MRLWHQIVSTISNFDFFINARDILQRDKINRHAYSPSRAQESARLLIGKLKKERQKMRGQFDFFFIYN
jgi:hypothetical protein